MAVGAHPYSFLTVRLKSKDPRRMFYADFSKRLLSHKSLSSSLGSMS